MTEFTPSISKVIYRYCEDFDLQLSSLIEFSEDPSRADDLKGFTEQLYSEVHRMGGAAQCMGFRTVGRKFKAVEKELGQLLARKPRNYEAALSRVSEQITAIKELAPTITPDNSKLMQRANAIDDMKVGEVTTVREDAQQEATRRMLSKEVILFADDDAYIRELMRSTFEFHGIENVRLAASGAEVLATIRNHKPTMVITDWIMSPVNGLDLLKNIRKGHTTLDAETPVILYTSVNTPEMVSMAMRAGASKLLKKPVMPQTVLETVLNIVEKKYFAQPKPSPHALAYR